MTTRVIQARSQFFQTLRRAVRLSHSVPLPSEDAHSHPMQGRRAIRARAIEGRVIHRHSPPPLLKVSASETRRRPEKLRPTAKNAAGPEAHGG